MVDIAYLAIRVDATQPERAAQSLGRLTQAGARAEAAATGVTDAYQRAAGSLSSVSRANQQATVHATAFGRAMQNAGQKTQAAAGGLGRAAAQARTAGTAMNSAAGYTGNLAAQFNDIGVQLASGQSPLLLAVQQGTQINQVLAQMGRGGGGAVQALGAAFTSIISPVSLLTIGLIAGGAALAQWGIKALSAGKDTRSLADLTEDLADSTADYVQAAEDAAVSVEDLAAKYGERLAPAMREVRTLQAEIEQGFAQIDLNAFSDAFARQIQQPRLGGIIQNSFRGGLSELFELGDAPQRMQHLLEESLRSIKGLTEEYDKAAGNAEKQVPILDEIFDKLYLMSGAVNDRSKEELQLLDLVNQYRESALEVVAIKLDEVTVTGSIAAEEQKRSDWAARTLADLQAQTAASQAVAQFGQASVEVAAQQAQAARDSLEADIQRRDVSNEMAASLRAAHEAQMQADQAAQQRIATDRAALQLAQEREQSAQRQAALDAQRSHAEEAISQRLRNRIQVAQAIVVHGKDSVQAKLAEEAVSKRLFELDLQRQGITGGIRDQLMAQYEAAAQLEGAIVQAQPTFQGLKTTVDSIATAWGEFVVTGFQDFRSFTRKVFDSFKQLLVQMIATAARNKIMISLGMSGAGGAGGGGGGLLGGLLGGGGGGGGLLGGLLGGGGGGGGPMSMLSGLFGGGGGGGGGFLSGLFGGGGAAVGSFGAPIAGGGGLLAGIAPVVPVIAGAALVAGALMKTSTEVDKGAKILVEGLEATAKGYTTVEESRFFGLSKRERDRGRQLDPRYQTALETGSQATIREVKVLADFLKIGTDSLSDFSTEIQLSVLESKGAVEAFGEIRNEMAQIILESAGVTVALSEAGDKLRSLGRSLIAVTRTGLLQGQSTFLSQDLAGAQSADALVQGFGGAEQYAKATAAFYQDFFTEGERVANLQRQLNGQLRRAGVEVIPQTLQAYRELANSQDLTTESGRRLYTTMLELAPQIAEVIDYERQLADSRQTIRESLMSQQELLEAARERLEAVSADAGRWAVRGDQGRHSMLAFVDSINRAADAGQQWGIELQGQLPGLVEDFNLVREAAGSAASELSSVQGGGGGGRFEVDRRAGGAANEFFYERASNRARQHRASLELGYLSGVARTEEELRQLQNPRLLRVNPDWRFGREAAEPGIVQTFQRAIREAVLNVEDYRASGVSAARRSHMRQIEADFFRQQARTGVGPHTPQQWATMSTMARQAAAREAQLAARMLEQAVGEINFAEFLGTMQHLGTAFDAAADGARDMARNVFDIFENVGSFQQAAASYYQNFFTEGERRNRLREELALSFDLLGVAMPKTRNEFRQLVEAQDLATHRSRQLFAGLLDLSDEFASLTDPIDGLAGSAANLNETLGESQRIFRSLQEEVLLTSAGNTNVSGRSAIGFDAPENAGLLRQLISAVNSGNITIVRRLDEINETRRRDQMQPTRASV